MGQYDAGFPTQQSGILFRKRYTASGTFNPLSDGMGRTLFKIRYGGGGGGGAIGCGGGQGQILQTEWIEIFGPLTLTIGAGGLNSVGATQAIGGGDTTIVGTNISLVAYGAAAGATTNVGGRTRIQGSFPNGGATNYWVTGGGNNQDGAPGMMNPILTYNSAYIIAGGIQLNPGGVNQGSNTAGGAGGYLGNGGAPGASGAGIGYSSGSGSENASAVARGKQGFVEFIWI